MGRNTLAMPAGIVAAIGLNLACAPAAATHKERASPPALPVMLEIRSYNLKPGSRRDFHELVEQTVPMVRRFGIDVVAYGPSAHDTSSYFLMRAFRSVAERERLEGKFYGSSEWQSGPRDRVLSHIDSYTTIVIPLDSAGVARLRTSPSSPPTMIPNQDCEQPSKAEAIAAIVSLNEQYIGAVRDNDAAWFRRHMGEDVLVVLSNGRRLNKTEFVAMVAETPAGSFKSLVARDVNVRVFGATAQVDADSHWSRPNGTSGISRYIDTYAWRDCRWQVVSAQITAVPPTSGGG